MRLIVGLGNPGSEYANTRHNAGWLALDHLAKAWGMNRWQANKGLNALIIRDIEHDIVLAKPTTMMNNSGWAVQRLLDYYKLTIGDLIVIHDDADLDLGNLRLSDTSRTGAGHHGVLSIIEHVGPGFRRLRVGIGRPEQSVRDISNYVLDRLTKNEQEKLQQSFNTLKQDLV